MTSGWLPHGFAGITNEAYIRFCQRTHTGFAEKRQVGQHHDYVYGFVSNWPCYGHAIPFRPPLEYILGHAALEWRSDEFVVPNLKTEPYAKYVAHTVLTCDSCETPTPCERLLQTPCFPDGCFRKLCVKCCVLCKWCKFLTLFNHCVKLAHSNDEVACFRCVHVYRNHLRLLEWLKAPEKVREQHKTMEFNAAAELYRTTTKHAVPDNPCHQIMPPTPPDYAGHHRLIRMLQDKLASITAQENEIKLQSASTAVASSAAAPPTASDVKFKVSAIPPPPPTPPPPPPKAPDPRPLPPPRRLTPSKPSSAVASVATWLRNGNRQLSAAMTKPSK